MKQIVVAILCIIAVTSLVSCNSSSTTPSNPTSYTQDGPLNYYALAARLGAPVTLPQSQDDISLKSAASTTATVSGIIADTIPGAGIIFGPINVLAGAFGSNAEDAKLQDQIDNINNTLVSIQNQINSLQAQITADNSMYNNFVQQQGADNACSALLNWDTALQNIYAAPSNYINPIPNSCSSDANPTHSGIGNYFMGYINGQGVESAALSLNVMSQIAALSSSQSSSFQSYINSLSTTSINVDKPTNTLLSTSWNYKVYGYVVSSSPSTTICSITSNADATSSMLSCGYQYLVDNLLPIPTVQSSNVVTNINNYNQLLFNMYQQDLLALQYAYTIEATSNYMNYVAYSTCLTNGGSAASCANSTNQIPSWEQIAEITFSVGTDSTQVNPNTVNSVALAGQYLTSAQQNLVTIYAARINALYKNIMNFTISDNPLYTQSYTPPPASITMPNGPTINFKPQNNMYSTIQAATLSSAVNSGAIPGAMLNSGTGQPLNGTPNGGLFYQYNGINQVWSCLAPSTTQTLNNPNGPVPTINLLACESAFPNSSNSYYDGVTMQAYGASSTGVGGVVQTASLNTNTYCNDVNSFANLPASLINYPVAWSDKLLCNIWGGSEYVNSSTFPGQTPPLNLKYLDYPSNYIYMGSPGSAYSFQVPSNSLSQNFYEVGSSGCGVANDCVPGGFYYGNNAGNFQYLSSSPWGIYSGGFPSGRTTSEGMAYVALLQVTLPNGYIFPFYLYTAVYNETTQGVTLGVFGALVCTSAMQGQIYGQSATPPGVASCVQNANSTGGLTVGTTDGSGYTILLGTSNGYYTITVTPS